ncbi:hypothetical protein OBE_17261 [human gut metagenome]|uniref:Uncharacterized protein n=1 Tax=human gut metagenome TaxID=408170 RepID=K1RH66_9ZZZZ
MASITEERVTINSRPFCKRGVIMEKLKLDFDIPDFLEEDIESMVKSVNNQGKHSGLLAGYHKSRLKLL